MDRATKLGFVFTCVFAVPFAGFGLFAIVSAIQKLLADEVQASAWMLLVFGLVFAGFGFGLVFAVVYGGKALKEKKRAQAEHRGCGGRTGRRGGSRAAPART